MTPPDETCPQPEKRAAEAAIRCGAGARSAMCAGGEDDAAANIVGGPEYSTLSNGGLMLFLAIAARSLYR